MPFFISVFGLVYAAVFVTEIVGDRSLYAIGSLGARLGTTPVMFGISAAFGVKMLVAVALGETLARLPSGLLRALAVASLAGAALMIWRESQERGAAAPKPRRSMPPFLAAFTAVFFIEWADPGQLAAAMLSTHYQMPAVVWAAATAALVTKGALALTLGVAARRWLPQRVLRNAAIATLVCLALLVASGIAS